MTQEPVQLLVISLFSSEPEPAPSQASGQRGRPGIPDGTQTPWVPGPEPSGQPLQPPFPHVLWERVRAELRGAGGFPAPAGTWTQARPSPHLYMMETFRCVSAWACLQVSLLTTHKGKENHQTAP